jgi:hypothetical protein
MIHPDKRTSLWRIWNAVPCRQRTFQMSAVLESETKGASQPGFHLVPLTTMITAWMGPPMVGAKLALPQLVLAQARTIL